MWRVTEQHPGAKAVCSFVNAVAPHVKAIEKMDQGRDEYVVHGIWWTEQRRIYATTGGLVPDSNWPGVGSVVAGAASSV